ncbi:MAG TPA: hypothetical protein VLJ59_18910 [Mycobacteriales bacterium]|nr:hypothetical protein [Mycobacteriales bacterium]
MPHSITWIDRLRIERVVWTLDQRLYDLPRRSRIAKRRELRDNILVAARDVGTSPALRRLGDSRRLADEYLTAELGEGPRHSWVAAILFGGTVPLLINYFLGEAASAYGQAITATDPNATGTFVWGGVHHLQETVTYTFTQGQASITGGAWTPVCWALWILGTVLAGRLWRLLSPVARQRRAAPTA